jgi:thioredoxin-related protein
MKKLLITVLLLIFGFSYASAQRVEKPLTQEQRMVQSNAKHKNGKNNTDLAKKVKQAKKQDRKARKKKSSGNRTPKRK